MQSYLAFLHGLLSTWKRKKIFEELITREGNWSGSLKVTVHQVLKGPLGSSMEIIIYPV